MSSIKNFMLNELTGGRKKRRSRKKKLSKTVIKRLSLSGGKRRKSKAGSKGKAKRKAGSRKRAGSRKHKK